MPDFIAYKKIPRLFKPVIISEKIDGTSAVIHISEDGIVTAGSRNRWIAVGDDNYGFAAWVEKNRECLLGLGAGYHYGEWWGQGIQRGYGLKEKRFSLFNATKWYDNSIRPSCCHVVPILEDLDEFDTNKIKEVLERLRVNGSQAENGYMNPEGVVTFHVASGCLFKTTFNDKAKGDK